MPNRTTRDYEGPSIAPQFQAALDAALQDEDDIDVDGWLVHQTTATEFYTCNSICKMFWNSQHNLANERKKLTKSIFI